MTPHPVTVVDRGTFATILQWVGRITRSGEKKLAPLVDLIIRVLIAKGLFVSAIIKLSDWDNALALSRDEYPVAWMDPVTAAVVDVTIELLGAVLLAAGLATRGAALALAVLALVIQFNYIALDTHLFWAMLFGWYMVRGAGSISLDASLARGLAASALPFAAPIVHALATFTERAQPIYLLLVRVLLGTVNGVDPADQFVSLESGQCIPYDYLVLAAARPASSLPVRSPSLRGLGWTRNSGASTRPLRACCSSSRARGSCRRFRKISQR